MKRNFTIPAVVSLAAVTSVLAHSAPPDLSQLAEHPQCYVSGDTVFVRGAVVDAESGFPVPNARVHLAYGVVTQYVTTGAGGIYQAEFPRSLARGVLEISTSIPAPTGTLVPTTATEGTGSCVVPAARVGDLEQIRSAK